MARGGALREPRCNAVLRLALLLAAAALAAGDRPPWYKCRCVARDPRCICPSLYPPGGLAAESTPQFVLFTHDDAINAASAAAMKAVVAGRQHANGCPLPATMFTLVNGTDCRLLLELHARGWEIADHTISHRSMMNMSQPDRVREVLSARDQLAACGIPATDIVGFRAPYLDTNRLVRDVLDGAGFLYDSTMIELGGTTTAADSLSYGMPRRVWPFTMDYGVPMGNCQALRPAQYCYPTERHPGVFQVPVWDLKGLGGPFSMDYGDSDSGASASTVPTFDFLKANFDAAYNGNRAPFPIYIHTPWLLSRNHTPGLQRFVDYALRLPDVHFVTMRQLLAWMRQPVAADKLTPEALGCGNPGGAGPARALPAVRASPPLAPPLKRRPLKAPKPPPLPKPPRPDPPSPPPPSPPPPSPPPPSPPPPLPPSPPPPSPSPPPPTPPPPPAFPDAGVRITFFLAGIDEQRFLGPPSDVLVQAVIQRLLSQPSFTFVTATDMVPAGTALRSLRWVPATQPRGRDGAASLALRRGLLQQGATGDGGGQLIPRWLEVTMVAGGDPLQMYYRSQEKLTDAQLAPALLGLGAQLASPVTVVPFQDGVDLEVPAGADAPSPAALAPTLAPREIPDASGDGEASNSSGGGGTSSSGGGVPVAVIAGAAAGAVALVLVALACFVVFFLRPRQAAARAERRAGLAKVSAASSGQDSAAERTHDWQREHAAGCQAAPSPHQAAANGVPALGHLPSVAEEDGVDGAAPHRSVLDSARDHVAW